MAATVGRSVKYYWKRPQIFPNIYVVLIANSGRMRKSSSLREGENLFRKAFPSYDLFTEKTTVEALISSMHLTHAESGISSLYIISDEFNTLIGRSKQDQNLISHLTKFYDCPDVTGARTQIRGVEQCKNVVSNMLASTTPHWLRLSLPADVIGGGFTSRIIFVYEETTSRCFPIPIVPNNFDELQFRLIGDLRAIGKLKGTAEFTKDALDWYEAWYVKYDEPDLADDLLMGYFSRRHAYLWKVSLLLSMAKVDTLVVSLGDIKAAHALLLQQERWLPKVMQMLQTNVIGEVNSLVLNIISKSKRIVHSELLRRVSYKLGSQDLTLILDTLERAEMIKSTSDAKGTWYQTIERYQQAKTENENTGGKK